MGDETMIDPFQGMANKLDSLLTMISELSNKVNGQKKAPEEQLGSTSTSPWKSWYDGMRSS